MNTDSIKNFKHPEVRALAWTLLGPPLLRSPTPLALSMTNLFELGICTPEYCLERLIQLDKDPTKLRSWLEQHSTKRVGRYFESLVHYWLHCETSAELLAAGQQIRDEHSTIGEIDFLLRFEGRVIHIETAIKFYLQAQANPQWQDFLGPTTAHDSLWKKTCHLAQKQLPLGHHEQTLKRWELDVAPASYALIKGYLFYPWSEFSPAQELNGIARSHPRGIWARSNDLPFHHFPEVEYWAPISKPDWVGPYRVSAQTALPLTKEDLTTCIYSHFSQSSSPVLIASLAKSASGILEERHRFMIVDSKWPPSSENRCSD